MVVNISAWGKMVLKFLAGDLSFLSAQKFKLDKGQMKNGLNLRLVLWVSVLEFLMLARPVHAYFDPGTTSYLFQVLMAFGLGSIFFFKTILKKVRGIFEAFSSRKKKANEDEEK